MVLEKTGWAEVKKVLHFTGVGGGAAVLRNRFRMRAGSLSKRVLFIAGGHWGKREIKSSVDSCAVIETDQASTAVGSCELRLAWPFH